MRSTYTEIGSSNAFGKGSKSLDNQLREFENDILNNFYPHPHKDLFFLETCWFNLYALKKISQVCKNYRAIFFSVKCINKIESTNGYPIKGLMI